MNQLEAPMYMRVNDEKEANEYLRTGIWTDQSLHDRISYFAKTTPAQPAISDGTRSWTYLELNDYVLRLARTLLDLGVDRGEVVALQSMNTLHLPAMHAALAWIGAILAPVSPQWRDAEMLPLLSTSRAGLLIHTTDDSYDRTAAAASYVNRVASLREAISLETLDALVKEARPLDPKEVRHRTSKANDPQLAMCSSGSTGIPKIALHSFNNLYTQGVSTAGHAYGLSSNDITLAIAPANIGSTGYVYPILAALSVGAQANLLQHWSPEAALTKLRDLNVTVAVAVPTQMLMMLDHPVEKFNLRSLRVVLTGGAPLPPNVAGDFERRFGCRMHKVYGASDGGIAACTDLDTPETQRFSTVGRIARGHDVKILTNGQVAPPGTSGEVVWHGPSKSFGYLNQGEMDVQAWHGGYFHSGDIGVIDDDGYLSIVGRIKEMILRGGHNIFPAEIELLLNEHPAIESVVVVGVPDDRLGERACAVISAAAGHAVPSVEEIQNFLTERNLAKYKFPEFVVSLDQIPVNAGGKVDRPSINEIAREALAERDF
ncbi:acyl--CoA ligase [Marinobacter sp. 71-i]|uniref:Acyl--CoA ligase n=1 Tax=Marinobacter iranensis TaxID=2962607 RepID=A0ABT5YAV8_9GAMM|nr:class I adenylate-forming enzyme family protein [Marinobacter iranensis]MDF0750825.1 acyl--CoA ligase [Marinobacter iranensis]